jgi:hypothetical protein
MKLINFDPKSERIVLAHRRLKAAYERRKDAESPVVDLGVPPSQFSPRERIEDLDKLLAHAAGWANSLAAVESDWPPHIDTFAGVVVVAEAFGCKVVWTPNADPWTRPALGDISGVWGLKPRKPAQSPMIRRLSEWVDYAQRKLGTDLPMWTMDVQSPFSVAAHVVDPMELMTACITDPKAVHHLVGMITDYSIEMMRQHLAQMEHPGFPGRNYPSISENIGICIADDTPLIMLSPEMYREFALPYNSRIGEAFGGVHIHSCGDYRHNIDGLLQIKNVRSTQAHAGQREFPYPATAEEECPFNRARRRLTLLADTTDVSRSDEYRGRGRDHYAEYVLPRLCAGDMTGCIIQTWGATTDRDARESVQWIRGKVAELRR